MHTNTLLENLKERPRYRREDNIKRDLTEIVWESRLNSSGSGLDTLAGCCEHGKFKV
jgi:hypothetical protein